MDKKKFKTVEETINVMVRNTAVVILSTGLIVYPLHLPYTGAYFTDKASPQVNRVGRSRAAMYNLDENSNSIRLAFELRKFEALDVQMYIYDDSLTVRVDIPPAFEAEEIMVDSLELSYNGTTTQHIPSKITRTGNELSIVVNWDQAIYFDQNEAILNVNIAGKGSGNGISGLGEKFVFDGRGELVPPPQPEIVLEPKPVIKPAPIPKPEETPDSDEMLDSDETQVPEEKPDPEQTPEEIPKPEIPKPEVPKPEVPKPEVLEPEAAPEVEPTLESIGDTTLSDIKTNE